MVLGGWGVKLLLVADGYHLELVLWDKMLDRKWMGCQITGCGNVRKLRKKIWSGSEAPPGVSLRRCPLHRNLIRSFQQINSSSATQEDT